ncbi:hypothetical protein HYU19_05215 [Candidatus Woesearchaeota archaeon]|nr:hypothetical protein [Candidatus Woesearchaeota archaeon]
MLYQIIPTPDFKNRISRCEKQEERRISSLIRQLEEKGGTVGNPLAGFRFFREKRLNGKRVYFLVYQQYSTILLVAISDKKEQQATITKIMTRLEQYHQQVIELLKYAK